MKITQIGKQNARIVESRGCRVLYSYQTAVALEAPNGKYYRTDKKWSVTTSKHINKFVGADVVLVPQSALDDWQGSDFS